VLIVVGLIGGCTSSTGCSVKVFRYHDPVRGDPRADARLLQPECRDLRAITRGGRWTDEVIDSVILFFTCSWLTFGVLAVAAVADRACRPARPRHRGLDGDRQRRAGLRARGGATGAVERFPIAAKW
jgi:trk system potassium uptake protein